MFIFDITVIGFYTILSKIVYPNGTRPWGSGAEEHAVFLAAASNVIPFFIGYKYIAPIFTEHIGMNHYFTISVIILVFFVFFYIYAVKNRIQKLLVRDYSNFKKWGYSVISVLYISISLWIFLQ